MSGKVALRTAEAEVPGLSPMMPTACQRRMSLGKTVKFLGRGLKQSFDTLRENYFAWYEYTFKKMFVLALVNKLF